MATTRRKKKESIDQLRRKMLTRVNRFIKENKSASEYYDLLRFNKDTTLSQIAREETRKFDEKWINQIEDGVNALERIVKDPKKFIKTQRNVVPIELARKITSESVRHLASHSQYVKDIDRRGNIIPQKILNISAEDDYEIYENRFLKTLVDRLIIFMETRYEYMIKNAITSDSDFLKVTSKVQVGEATYEYETKIKISVPSKDEGKREFNEALMRKIALLRRRIQFISQSEFMGMLKECKPVPSPINMTNILRKNIDYHAAYELSKFLDEYDRFGIKILVKETPKEFTKRYEEEIMKAMMVSCLSLEKTQVKTKPTPNKTRKYVVKPKIIKRVDDALISDAKFDMQDPQYASYLSPEQKALLRKEKLRKEKLKKAEAKKERLALRALREKERKQLMELKEKQRRKLLREKMLQMKKEEEEKRRLALIKERELAKKRRLEEKEREKERIRLRKERERVRMEALKEKEKEKLRLQKLKEREKAKKLLAKQKEKEKNKAKKAKASKKVTVPDIGEKDA